MEFKEPEIFEVSVVDDDTEVGALKKADGWKFATVGEHDYFTASDLRAIADELDMRNERDGW